MILKVVEQRKFIDLRHSKKQKENRYNAYAVYLFNRISKGKNEDFMSVLEDGILQRAL